MTMRNSQIQKEDILQDNSSIYSAIVGYNKGTMPDFKKKRFVGQNCWIHHVILDLVEV